MLSVEFALLVCRFVGSWLLVAGPIYQAALELGRSDEETDRLRARMRDLAPPKVSPWWWVLPPVKVVLERVYLYQYRNKLIEGFTPSEFERMLDFQNKATGWLFVAGGGLLLGINETWEIAERWHWPAWAWGVCCFGMTLSCVLNTVFRLSITRRMLEQKKGVGAPEPKTRSADS